MTGSVYRYRIHIYEDDEEGGSFIRYVPDGGRFARKMEDHGRFLDEDS